MMLSAMRYCTDWDIIRQIVQTELRLLDKDVLDSLEAIERAAYKPALDPEEELPPGCPTLSLETKVGYADCRLSSVRREYAYGKPGELDRSAKVDVVVRFTEPTDALVEVSGEIVARGACMPLFEAMPAACVAPMVLYTAPLVKCCRVDLGDVASYVTQRLALRRRLVVEALRNGPKQPVHTTPAA
jgi:hypothetical protein